MDWEKVSPQRFCDFMCFVKSADNRKQCWEWTGNTDRKGYGIFSYEGKNRKAHRWILSAIGVDVPDDKVVRHHCDNPRCVNPAHLAVGTQKENVQDRQDRGRGADRKGEKHPLARMNESSVKLMRNLKEQGWTHKELAERFPVSSQQAGKICRRENWRHI